ncbi:MAG: DUF3368 domain-containing protein [Limisphaerales bacterium]
MTLIVADAGPLRYLVLIEAIDVLPALYDRVSVPPAVLRELSHPSAPPAVQAWSRSLPKWVAIRTPAVPHGADELGPGESEAIALALELRADAVLIDEIEGRRAALTLGLKIRGTVGILEMASERGLLDLERTFEKLGATNFRIDPSFLAAAIARHRASVHRDPGMRP